jgi:energy-coupling factor transporter ATP-binding protein EcfA2
MTYASTTPSCKDKIGLLPTQCGDLTMISQFSMQNFKCFQNAHIDLLKNFNVIVGASGSGKTSLLEALFLHGGSSPEIYFRIRGWRGFGSSVSLTGTKESYEALFRDMFYNFDSAQALSIASMDSDGKKRELRISFRDDKNYILDLDKLDENAFLIDPIIFEWTIAGRTFESTLELKEGRMRFTGSAPPGASAYYNAVNLNSGEDVAAFSSLSKKFQVLRLTEELSRVFGSYGDLSIELIGGSPLLHVSAGLAEKIPLVDISGGVRKYVSIALGILINPKGTVIVDEFESGFYYDHLSLIWESLVRLCEENETQLIISTHSYEFLKAIAPSLEKGIMARKFQLIRLERGANQPKIKRIEGEAYHAAIANDFEVR